MAKKPPTIRTTLQHILDNVLIAKTRAEGDGVITLVRPDFSARIDCPGIKPNSSPGRVEIDTRACKLRIWSWDIWGEERPNRIIKNAFTAEIRTIKVCCIKCGELDVESFIGPVGQNGWRLDGDEAICPDCKEREKE